MNAKSKTSTHQKEPNYIGWRGELLAKLALSRLPNLTVIAQPLEGRFDFSVMTDDGLTFLVEVKALSSTRDNLRDIETIEDLRWTFPSAHLRDAKSMRCPVFLFLFDADTEHGRFLRLDNMEARETSSRQQSVYLPRANTITTESLHNLLRGLRPASEQQPQIPLGTKKIIIFDTNAYRDLTSGLSLADSRSKALQLRQNEQNAGTFALASPIIIWELIGHLGNPNDPAYHRCLNALVALAEHTWSPYDPNGGICLFADAESTVCRELFGTVPPNAERNIQNLSKLASHIKGHAPNLTLPAALNNLKAFSSELKKREERWLADMQKVLADCDPKIAKAWVGGTNDKDIRRKLRAFFASQAFMEAWASITVMRHAKFVYAKVTPAELVEKTKLIRDVFPVPFHLMSMLLQKLPTPSPMNMASARKNRGNFVWDTSICFSIGDFHEVDGAPMFLVTGDKAIKEAATVAKCPDRVVTLPDYLKNTGLQ